MRDLRERALSGVGSLSRAGAVAMAAGLAWAGGAMAQPGGAPITFWTTPTSGSWFDFARWSTGVPSSTTTAHMSGVGAYLVEVVSADAHCHHLSIGNAGTTLGVRAVGANGFVTVYGTQIENAGTISIGGPSNTASALLRIATNCTVNGPGEIVMDGAAGVAEINGLFGAPYLLVQNAGHMIRGSGRITSPFQNEGLVHADMPGRELALASWGKTNNGQMRASGGGALRIAINTGSFTQGPSGEIVVEDGSRLSLQGAGDGLIGGSIRTEGTGFVQIESQGVPLNGVAFEGEMRFVSNNGVHIGNAGITNNGLINLGAQGFFASTAGGSATVLGNGRLQLEGGQLGRFLDGFSYTIVNGADHAIGGIGNLQAAIINHGTISADRNGLTTGPSELVFQQAPKTNHGLIEATGTGVALFSSVALTQSGTGVLHAGGGSAVALNNSTITGGTLTTGGTGVIVSEGTANTLANLALAADARVLVPCSGTTTLVGSITNDGTITIDNSGCGPSFATLRTTTGATVGGEGEIYLKRNPTNASATLQGGATSGAAFVLSGNQRLTGAGRVSGFVTISGIIDPDSPPGVGSPAGSEAGTLEVLAGSVLTMSGATRTRIDILGASTFDRISGAGSVVLDGTLRVDLTAYTPANLQTFDLVLGPSVSGAFDAVVFDSPYQVGGRVEVSANRARLIICSGDVTGDGLVDILDFLDFMQAFGECQGRPAPCGSTLNADFNGDTIVDIVDFLEFIDVFSYGC
ncbi:MAG: hypothetical protein KF838_12960 [Phycisphaeraceae bacterium]|nr:MAG: hypothetical protein KF838_12960 [Phycisphaeraceae bacterium]